MTADHKHTGKRPPARKRAYHHGYLKQALMEAAIFVLEEEGLESLSLRRVAREAGVSQTAPYSHFADKNALLAAVAAVGFTRLSERMCGEASGVEDPRQEMLALAQGYVGFAVDNPALFRLMFGPQLTDFAAYPELQTATNASFQRLVEAVGRRLTETPAPAADQAVGTLGAWAIVHGLATLMIDAKIRPEQTGAKDGRKLVEQVAVLLVNGLSRREQ